MKLLKSLYINNFFFYALLGVVGLFVLLGSVEDSEVGLKYKLW
ncbi:hypothetical protein [Flavobacterium limnophilum]|nr:hypothetical protein [Flavobacterium limnophilum]